MENDKRIEDILFQLKRKGYKVSFHQTSDLATQYLEEAIFEKTVGFGDSLTLHEIGLYNKLLSRNTVYDPLQSKNDQAFIEIAKKCMLADVYICSVNAAAQSGELVNIDGTGNRIAGSLFGHQNVFFVLGVNKIMSTLDEAIWRARNIAAPKNAQRLGLKTPCAIHADKCYDCSSADRICNALSVYYCKPDYANIEIVLINQHLGY